MPFAASMDLEIITLNEVSHTEKDKYHMTTTYTEFKKMIQMHLFMRQKQTQRHRKLQPQVAQIVKDLPAMQETQV